MQLTFYKDEQGWFLDAPEYIENKLGTKTDLQMVSGADNLLDLLCVKTEKFAICPDVKFPTLTYEAHCYSTNEVLLEVQVTPFVGATTLKKLSDEEGWYIQLTDGHLLWLCPVTKWVFGDYPPFIYYKKV